VSRKSILEPRSTRLRGMDTQFVVF